MKDNLMDSVHFQESIDTFKVKFEGGNSIDAELFTRTINNIIDLVKASANAVDPKAFLRLEIKATKEGSFETSIDAVAKYANDLITKDNLRLAGEIVAGFLAFLQIKSHLKGEKPKSIKNKGKTSYITNQEGIESEYPQNIAEIYLKDAKIDNTIINIFTDLQKSGRDGLSVEHKEQTSSFKKEDCENMAVSIVAQEKDTSDKKISETHKNCELIIKKLDLIGRSKWTIIFAGRQIETEIIDEEFLLKSMEGGITFSRGCKLVCDLTINFQIDKEYNPIKTEHIITKVHGIKNREEQLQLFENK